MTRGVAGWILVLGAVPLMAGTPAVAQIGAPVERNGTPVDRDCVCMDDLRDRVLQQVRVATRHPRLGVVLGDPEEVGGRQGIRAARVPENSPAHRAGLREGDVIVAIDGRDLGTDPAAALRERLTAVAPGDTVEVEFVRGGEAQTARVVPGNGDILRALGDEVRLQIPAMRRARAAALEAADGARIRGPGVDIHLRHAGRHGLEMTAVNPELGEYFGTDRGVLVTAVNDDSLLNLRPGDVVLAVGDREVRDPAHLRSILASYRDDETITLRIIREQRTQQITAER